MFHTDEGWVTKATASGGMIRIPMALWLRGNPDGTRLKDPRLERAKAFIEDFKRENRITDAAALLHDDDVKTALRTIELWANLQLSKTISTSQGGSHASDLLSRCG